MHDIFLFSVKIIIVSSRRYLLALYVDPLSLSRKSKDLQFNDKRKRTNRQTMLTWFLKKYKGQNLQ